MRNQQTDAFVLHRRPYRESSLLVEAYTRDLGRVAMIARGARKSRKSPRSSVLQHYVPLRIGLAGRGELRTLAQVDALGPQLLPAASRAALVALYLNELLLKLTPREDPHPQLFDSYRQTLVRMSAQPLEPALRCFELDLLEALGYGLELEFDTATGEAVDASAIYRYELESGPVAAAAGQPGLVVSGQTLLGLAQREFSDTTIRSESRLLLRSVISHYLGGRPLKTRELLKGMPDLETK